MTSPNTIIADLNSEIENLRHQRFLFANEVAELRQFLDAAIADARYFKRHRNVLLVALSDCSFALNQFDPYDDIECLWQLKSDVDVDSVLSAARNAISIVKGKP